MAFEEDPLPILGVSAVDDDGSEDPARDFEEPAADSDLPWAPRRAPDVSAQPRMALSGWRILDLGHGQEILCGWLPNGSTLRKTSPIAWFSQSLREIVTSSGRRYELVGPPATDPESLVLMAWHLEASGCDVADEIADITSLYWGAITGATH